MAKVNLALGQDFKKSKLVLFSGVILALIVLVSLFWLRPKIMAIMKANKELAANKKILAELTKKVTVLEGLSQPELSERVDLVLKVLPSEKDIPTVMVALKKIALNNGLVVSELNIPEVGEIATVSAQSKVAKEEILPSLAVKLILIGSREKIISFLKQVETTAPLMRVSGLVINQKGGGLDEALIDVKTYFLPFPKTLGKVEQAIIPVTSQEEKIFSQLSKIEFFQESESLSSSPLPAGKADLFSY